MTNDEHQDAETFVLEPETQLDGSPAPERAWLRPPSPGGRLAAPALVALAEGAALLICFLLLPWYGFPYPTIEPGGAVTHVQTYTGLDAALGLYGGGRLER